ncbi:MAG: hypothetical protein ACXAB5_05880, partial [Candidatus Thorarchaeota archaeon]
EVECFDDFLNGIKKFSLPEFDYCRVTFTDIPELAELCTKREFRLHHRLHKMTLALQKKNRGGAKSRERDKP